MRRFFSLQKGKAAAERIEGLDLAEIGPDLKDFTDTAAVISQLDLVITVDTAVAHLTAHWASRSGRSSERH